MTSDKREKAIKYLTEEIRSLRMAPQINGCGPENWEEQLEIMETCLEAVRNCDEVAIRSQYTARSVMESEVMRRPFVRDITKVCECACVDGNHYVEVNKMVPLTLEQLRGMDGQPVWCKSLINGKSEWAIIRIVEMSKTWFIALAGASQGFGDKDTYGKTWLAHAYPPAHIDREAWTAEWRELHGDKLVGFDDCGDDVYRHYHYSVCTSCGKGSAVKSNFCPKCGKAMTPEAWAELEKRVRV